MRGTSHWWTNYRLVPFGAALCCHSHHATAPLIAVGLVRFYIATSVFVLQSNVSGDAEHMCHQRGCVLGRDIMRATCRDLLYEMTFRKRLPESFRTFTAWKHTKQQGYKFLLRVH